MRGRSGGRIVNRARYHSAWMVRNPRVILKQAPGNRSDGFRSCLTRSASSGVARPEDCRPMLALWIIEGLPLSELVRTPGKFAVSHREI